VDIGAGRTDQVVPVCPRHPDRESYVRCQRCERPTCPECQRVAPVGIQCVDCVREGARTAPRTRTTFGGRTAADGRPLVTWAIIAICVVGNVLQRLPRVGDEVTQAFAFIPAIVLDEPWRLVTVAFMHDSSSLLPFHLALNMYAMWILGPYLEHVLGRARFAALFAISAVGGSVGFELLVSDFVDPVFGPPNSMVGASGAVFGLFGALVLVQRHLGMSSGPLLGLLGINLVFGFIYPGIAWQGHLGGLVTGVACGLALVYAPRQRRSLVQWGLLAAITAGVLAAAVAGAGR